MPPGLQPLETPFAGIEDEEVPEAEDLPEKDLAYYRQTWGFDPIRDRTFPPGPRGELYYYEVTLALVNDPLMEAADVQLIARVEVDQGGESHNRLGFRRGICNSLIFSLLGAIVHPFHRHDRPGAFI